MAEAIASDPITRKVTDTETFKQIVTKRAKQFKKVTTRITYFPM